MNNERDSLIQQKLLEHPEGLTIQDLADLCSVSVVTMAKDLDVLVAKNDIHRRVIGSAKIHYHLKNVKKFKEKTCQ